MKFLLQLKQNLKPHFLIPAIYWLIVLICSLYSFGLKNNSYELFLALFILTLPWSILAGFFILGALHLGDEKGIVILFMICASINAILYYLVAKPKKELMK